VSTRTIRVGTWNLHGLRAGVEVVARVVRAEAPDILLVQESGPRRRLRALGAALGLVVCGDPPAFPRRRVQNAVLLRPSRRILSHRLVRFDAGSLLHPRGALIARCEDVVAVSVHLGLQGPERSRQVDQLLELLEPLPEPVVLGGDLNARPDDASPARIAASYPDAWSQAGEGDGWTFPAHAPAARIDFVHTSEALRSLRAWTAGAAVSDHLMVVADLERRS
jgi:endonuclease/exonuclease/phosphatase family metal-dependent hydrolase